MNNSNIFWQWFQANDERLTMLADLNEQQQHQLLDEMQRHLDDYQEGLTFIIGDPTPPGRTLTFTAEGDTDLFPALLNLTDNAPILDWWEVVPFKQPAGSNLRIRFDNYTFDTSRMHFMQLECEEEPEFMGLRVAVDLSRGCPGKTPTPDDEDLQVGVYVTIEALIGEFDCATLLGYLEVVPLPDEPFKAGFQPLDDLPKFVDWFKRQRDK